ncbi:MAG: Ig-like domain repeat protein [Acidobacteria bacterium]|nr:Ig-like domain repeat protein [Acidobacteriota bacterium]
MKRMTIITRSLLLFGFWTIIALLGAAVGRAATITVDRTDDTAAAAAAVCSAAANDCSLRGALAYADTHSGTTVSVPAGTYSLTIDELVVGGAANLSTTIVGAGAATTVIRQTRADRRVFDINPGLASNVVVSISKVTIRDGRDTAGNGGGGGIYAGGPGNALNLTDCIFDGNAVSLSDNAEGGAINYSGGGTLAVDNCVFRNNSAGNPANPVWGYGGAIYFAAATRQSILTVTDSLFDGNSAKAVFQDYPAGGAIEVDLNATVPHTVNITNNTFVNNRADGTDGSGRSSRGGAIGYNGNEALTVKYNRIVGNTAAGGGSGIYSRAVAGSAIDATENWWGCNEGPGNPGCDSAGDAAAGVTTAPRIVLTHSAAPNTIGIGQTSTLTASFLTDSNGGALTAANVSQLVGLPVAFNNAVRGTISNAQPAIQSNGTATATFTGTSAGAASAAATVDNETQTAALTVNKFASVTTIASDAPDPSSLLQNVTVSFTVAPAVPGSGTPTGNVTVSDGTVSCTATVAAGQCTLSFSSYGSRTLTAVYAGDANFLGSTSAGETHTVCGAIFFVSTTGDSGFGSLRQTVQNVCDGGVIQFSPSFQSPQTISLSSGQITIDKDLTINGPGANLLTVRNTAAASPTSRVFLIAAGNHTVTLNGMTVSGGNVTGGTSGAGGIYYTDADLTLTAMNITGNHTAGLGGGLRGDAGSTLQMSASTVSGNDATGVNVNGGGIYTAGDAAIVNSTIAGNSAPNGFLNGGGIYTSGLMTLTNSTVTDNLAAANGASGVMNQGTVLLRDTIVAANRQNAAVPDVFGNFDPASAYNLIGNAGTATGISAANQNQLGTAAAPLDPKFELNAQNQPNLANNGGPTPTVKLLTGSPAIDAGAAASFPFAAFGGKAPDFLAPVTTDQRGLPRPADQPGVVNAPGGDGSDLGAVELQIPTAAGVSVGGRVLTQNGSGIRNARVILTDSAGRMREAVTGTFGYYRFDDVAAGEACTIQIVSRRYVFAPQTLIVTDEIGDLDFVSATPD